MALDWNVNQYGSDTLFQRDLDRVAAITPGAMVRLDAVDEYITSSPGVYNWSDLDRRVNEVGARSLIPHLMIPYWMDGYDKNQPDNATVIANHVAFTRALGLRYSTRVKSAELGNEPNLATPFAPDCAKPELQARIAIQVADSLPTSWTLVSPGMAPASSNGCSLSPTDYLARFWPIAGYKFDAAAIHPYGRSADASQSWSTLGQIPGIHTMTGVPIWATEYNGWVLPDSTNATWVAQTLPWLDALGYVPHTFIFAMTDPTTESGPHLGVYDSAGNPRPVLSSITGWLS
jgi:hypothetical protein